MDYSTVTAPPTGLGETKVSIETMRHSLYETLQGLYDPRRGAGKRYPLPVLICLLCLAKMAGQTTLKGATEWVRLRAEPLADQSGASGACARGHPWQSGEGNQPRSSAGPSTECLRCQDRRRALPGERCKRNRMRSVPSSRF